MSWASQTRLRFARFGVAKSATSRATSCQQRGRGKGQRKKIHTLQLQIFAQLARREAGSKSVCAHELHVSSRSTWAARNFGPAKAAGSKRRESRY